MIRLKETDSIGNRMRLNNGTCIPVLGYGTRAVKESAGIEESLTICLATECGYRHIDTAARYGNEAGVGEGIKKCGLKREKIFVTTKLCLTQHGYDNARKAFEESKKKLKLEYVDLYLIHWPMPKEHFFDWKDNLLETWAAMEAIYHEGEAKAIGVCNCLPEHLAHLIDKGKILPAVNQIEFHPGFTQFDTLRFCREYDILVEGWSPLGQGGLLKMPLLVKVAKQYGKTPAQLCIRYAMQHDVLPIVKSVNKDRMIQNAKVFDFTISAEDMNLLDNVPLFLVGPHPAHGYILEG